MEPLLKNTPNEEHLSIRDSPLKEENLSITVKLADPKVLFKSFTVICVVGLAAK